MKSSFPFHRLDKPVCRPRVTEVRKIGPTEQPTFIFIGDDVRWFGVHWDVDHTAPCRKNRSECKRCIDKVPWKSVGFLHVYEERVRTHFFIEMTDYAGERLKVIQGDRPTLRGMVCMVARERKTIRSPLYFTHLGTNDEDRLHGWTERDPEPTMAVLYKL